MRRSLRELVEHFHDQARLLVGVLLVYPHEIRVSWACDIFSSERLRREVRLFLAADARERARLILVDQLPETGV